MVCPPFTALAIAREYADENGFLVGAQNFQPAEKGTAQTGEISAEMLVEIGAKMVIVGHSERRATYFENDTIVAYKVNQAILGGLTPILCVGETLEQMEKGKTHEVLSTQLKSFVDGVIVAYEPVWAIGTGKVATPTQIAEVHAFIKSIVGENTAVLYGGSVNEKNAKEILATENVDGVLVGGASLDPNKFMEIIGA